MKHYKTEAVILDTTDVFDADRTFLLFTREYGKLRVRAKGVRKPTSRLTGHLLAYVPTQVEMVAGGGWPLITQAQIQVRADEKTYPDNPMVFMRQAGAIAEAINRLYVDEEPHPDVYDGLVYTLERLLQLCQAAEPSEKVELVTAEFLMKALAELGYRPELHVCVATGGALDPEWIGWSNELGGVVSKEGRGVAVGIRQIRSAKAVVALRQFLQPYFFAERLAMPPDVQREVVSIVLDYMQYQIGQPLRSWQLT